MRNILRRATLALPAVLASFPAFAEATAKIDTGDTAWMLTSIALVLMMTIPGPALIIGLVSGVMCFWAATSLKHMLGYDDSLDAFGVHGVGGIIGALLTGVFAYGPLSADAKNPDGIYIGGLALLKNQVIAVGATIIWAGLLTYILLKIIDATIGLRVTEEEEREGLDVVLHGERIS